MERTIDLQEISDGKRYGANDMVRADCGDCAGCSACCRGMGSSIVLDPLDAYRLSEGLKMSFGELLSGPIELSVADGIILPNLKMAGEEEKCFFLNEAGRCQIHAFRPGFCRMFPLGRIYENGSFQYFLQVHECKKENRAKVKVKKWLDTPDLARYESFVNEWHYFVKKLQDALKEPQTREKAKPVSMALLKVFYLTPYQSGEDFYEQFSRRMRANADAICALLD